MCDIHFTVQELCSALANRLPPLSLYTWPVLGRRTLRGPSRRRQHNIGSSRKRNSQGMNDWQSVMSLPARFFQLPVLGLARWLLEVLSWEWGNIISEEKVEHRWTQVEALVFPVQRWNMMGHHHWPEALESYHQPEETYQQFDSLEIQLPMIGWGTGAETQSHWFCSFFFLDHIAVFGHISPPLILLCLPLFGIFK